MDLAAYRSSAESFVAELMSAYYRHYAGLDDDYPIEAVYERHRDLFERPAVEQLRRLSAAAAPGGEDRRRLGMLLDFAVEGFVGQRTKELDAELARREAALSIAVQGEKIGFRQAAVVQANEPDREARAELEQARLTATEEHLNPLYRELLGRQHEAAAVLGFASYREMCERCKEIDLGALHAQTEAFAGATAQRYPAVLEPELRATLGFGLAELRRADLPRFFRAAGEDPVFPAERLVPALLETLHGLGIGEQSNVVLDVEPRPNKSPRAFCAPVRVPDEVYLVIAPVGGRDDYSALFHEAGHLQHYAHVDPGLAFEFRHLGDNSITEAFAFLLQHLVEDPIWLERRLAIDDPAPLISYARAHRLLYLRRYTGKLSYELALHGADGSLETLAERYAALLGGALAMPWPRETFLADVDPGFYSACYLRAWALEASLRGYFRERFGTAWFDSSEAGDALRSLWREGQRCSPHELLERLNGERLDFTALLADTDLL